MHRRRHLDDRVSGLLEAALVNPSRRWCSSRGTRKPRSRWGDAYQSRRQGMVETQLVARDIKNPRVLDAMRRVPRHEFVPRAQQALAYEDEPLPIGFGQTISQPYIVALMTQLADPGPSDRCLDIGTGSGYQAAVLAELAGEVYSVEIHCGLLEEAASRLKRLGYTRIETRCADGYRGWREAAPFDVIVLAAAAPHVPPALLEQLAPGGRLVLPVGDFWQDLVLYRKDASGRLTREVVTPVRFVPMTGEIRERPPAKPPGGKGQRPEASPRNLPPYDPGVP